MPPTDRHNPLMVGSQRKHVGVAHLLLALAAAGCARGRGAQSDAIPETEWILSVTNRHWLDVSVYVITDGRRARVGAVPAAGAATYILPPRMVGPARAVRLEATAIGSPARATTETLLVRAGQHVEWTLQSGLERSSVAVW
jgi:hypothetical protein